MKTSSFDQALQAKIESFVAELTTLVRASALESVQTALGAPPAVTRGRGRPRKSTTTAASAPAKRGKRTSEDVEKLANQVHAYVKSHSGERLEQIGTGLKVSTKTLKLPVMKLLQAKMLSTKGQKRGTKYFAK